MAADAHRPYLQHSISQLEALFERAVGEGEALQALRHELSFRSTVRAENLRARVVRALAGDVSESSVVATASAAPPPPVDHGRSTGAPAREHADNPASSPGLPTPERTSNFAISPEPAAPECPNDPAAILATWTALEALSPQAYRRPEDLAAGDKSCVAELTPRDLPWIDGERSRPKCKLYYQIILGAIPMDRATEDLIKAFGTDEERSPRAREKAAIAAVLVDRNGILVEEKGVAVSSFAWALPLALQLKLGSLGAWPNVEQHIVETLGNMLSRVDEDNNPVPLDWPIIETAHRWLVEQFALPAHLVEPPTFALRVYHYFKAKNPPEVSLLNSFFLSDLATASSLVERSSAPAGLRSYLGIDKPKEVFDLLSDRAALERAVAPVMMPAARWPGPGGHPLVMLQQAAVNLARSELAGREGIVAVNGPPGTGKTTLLRDIVAACVLDRALAMAAFDDPEKAFTPSGEKWQAGEQAFFHLYELAPGLKGHEILVASSNNKAVENVSRELPAAKAVGRTSEELSYFRSVSDLVHGPRNESNADSEEGGVAPEPMETWGLIAAVLGNAGNRSAFQRSFWWHDEFGFRLYLKAAKGDSVVREIVDPKSGKIIERHTPLIVTHERPPSPQAARANWQKARKRLMSLKREIGTELEALEKVRQLCLRKAEAEHSLVNEEAALAQLEARKPPLETCHSRHQGEVESARQQHERCRARVAHSLQNRPGFFARLFRTQRWRTWSAAHDQLIDVTTEAIATLKKAEGALSEASAALSALVAGMREAETRVAGLRHNLTELTAAIEAHRRVLGGRVVDEQLFARGHEALNLSAPWVPDELHRKREELFIAALAAHRAFIDASAQKVLHNLSVLMDVFAGGPPQDEARRKLLGDLWSTLWLVVPVLSTTFASVERMLGDLPPGSIGWLLVDEAGQALPQAAVGAVMRARRSIVVGDPLQIPPVVTLPSRLNSEVCKHFKVIESGWAAPKASNQTVADQASCFQSAFRSDQGPRRAGIPLLVHRRCQEPMFGISNRIAYDGQMVLATPSRAAGLVSAVLGVSQWLDIDGEVDSKWCPVEGELVVSLMRRLADARVANPDLFIITPFRIVAQELRRRLERERGLFSALNVNAREWLRDRVGTIHTVQGREAEAVILVLGAPRASQNGARSWAASTPNILNVAVSRAKQSLYVVGSHGAWSGVGHARELASSIPRTRPRAT